MEKATQLCQSGELHTVKQLREIAKSLEIPRYSTLSKVKLCKELASRLKVTIENVKGNENIELPNGFMDTITQDVLYDPYMLSDGFSYNKSSIERLFADANNPIGPESKQSLDKNIMIPNKNLKKSVLEWLIDVGKETEEEKVTEEPEERKASNEANFVGGIYWNDEIMQSSDDSEEEEEEQWDGDQWLIRGISHGEVNPRLFPVITLFQAGFVLFTNPLLCSLYLSSHNEIRGQLAGKTIFYLSPENHLLEYIIRNRRGHTIEHYRMRELKMQYGSNALTSTTGQVYRTVDDYLREVYSDRQSFAQLSEFEPV